MERLYNWDVSQEIEAELEKILANHRFRSAERISGFLRFVVSKTLSGEEVEIKESVIATTIYNRRADYDSRVQSIVRVEASRLRAKLSEYYASEGQADPIRIELPKGSYVPVFTKVEVTEDKPAEVAPDPVPEITTTPVVPPRRAWLNRQWLVLGGAAVVLAFVVARMTLLLSHPSDAGSLAVPVALKRFDNLSGGGSLDSFSAGLADELTANLGASANVRVVAQSSSAAPGADNLARFGSRTGARYLLDGSVRQTDGTIRIVARLISLEDGTQVWSNRTDAEAAGGIRSQERVSREIADEVRSVLHSVASHGNSSWTPQQKQAWELYRSARHAMGDSDALLMKGADLLRPQSLNRLTEIAGLYNQAIGLDPSNAGAFAGLAWVYQSASDFDPALVDKARDAAMRAVQIDANAAEAWAVLGYIAYFNEWDFAKAESNFSHALELEAGTPRWLQLYSEVASVRRHFTEAEQRLSTGQRILPGSLVIRHARAMLAYHRQDYATASQIARELIQLKPEYPLGYWILGLAVDQQGHPEEALRNFDQCLKLSPNDPRCTPARAYVLARTGHREEAISVRNAIRQRTLKVARSPYSVALVEVGLGNRDAALASLEEGLEQHDNSLPFLQVDPRFEPLHSAGRFHAVCRRLGIADAKELR